MKIMQNTWLIAASRFLVLIGLAFWLGGLVFLGAVAAPLLFQFCRAHHIAVLAPQIVGAMVTRFNIVTYVCGVLIVLGWLGESGLRAGRKLWWTQGICSMLMLLIALYSGLVLMPRLNTLQAQLLPKLVRAGVTTFSAVEESAVPLNSQDAALKATFDAVHQNYQQIAMLAWWLGILTLLALAVRTVVENRIQKLEARGETTRASVNGLILAKE